MKIELEKKPVTMKLSRQARDLMAALGQKHGMKGTAVVEAAVRRWAEQESIQAQAEVESK